MQDFTAWPNSFRWESSRGAKGEEKAGGSDIKTQRQQEKKIPSVTTSGGCVCVWWDGIIPLNPENIIVINCLLFCLQKINTV